MLTLDRHEMSPQLGPGAAIHLSDEAEPVASWLKAGGTVEGRGMQQAFSGQLLAAVHNKRVSAR
jgi:hypothetical protein